VRKGDCGHRLADKAWEGIVSAFTAAVRLGTSFSFSDMDGQTGHWGLQHACIPRTRRVGRAFEYAWHLSEGQEAREDGRDLYSTPNHK
jgi:hypothetical protein